jgi:hypothetical protein
VKRRFVSMLPVFLSTVMTPSSTRQRAGPVGPSWPTDTHSSRLRPSKSTIASDGGARLTTGPGVTTFGTGCHTSVSSGRPPGAPAARGVEERPPPDAHAASAPAAASAIIVGTMGRM